MMHKIYDLVPKKEIVTPKGGWKAYTYYVVQVSYAPRNPVHIAILGVGFLDKNNDVGSSSSYSAIWRTSYEHAKPFLSAWYIEVVRVIGKIKD